MTSLSAMLPIVSGLVLAPQVQESIDETAAKPKLK